MGDEAGGRHAAMADRGNVKLRIPHVSQLVSLKTSSLPYPRSMDMCDMRSCVGCESDHSLSILRWHPGSRETLSSLSLSLSAVCRTVVSMTSCSTLSCRGSSLITPVRHWVGWLVCNSLPGFPLDSQSRESLGTRVNGVICYSLSLKMSFLVQI